MIRKAVTLTALVGGILAAGSTPALAHSGHIGEYGKEKYQTYCATGKAGTTREVPRMFHRKPDTRAVQTGRTVTNRNGQHFHVVNVQKRTAKGWVTVERNKVHGCGYVKAPAKVLAPAKGTVNLAGVAWKLRTVEAPSPTPTDVSALRSTNWQ